MVNLDVLEQKDNALFPRKEVVAMMKGISATPSRAEAVKALGERLGTNPELIAVRRIEHRFGSKEAKVIAFVYPDAASLKKFEKTFVSARGKPKEKKEEKK